MNAAEIRQTFLDFFSAKGHAIVPSAPLVIKNDPTLMFTNAGMNQFKDLFLGNAPVKFPRVADTQKCLRVSGKHNDLEEVGVDTYHHTMFEMLGNWSFGDYFKKEAIAWAWELLTEVYKIPKEQIYVTVFGGSQDDGLPYDQEAHDCWKQFIEENRIIPGSKKDNFWEMGETGPCGPCSEIHVDIRDATLRADGKGAELVNSGHPQVIEIWNNVFMEFNRKADGSLEKLPAQHVDTGMGFERLCMVLQGKQSTYDTDVFQPLLNFAAAFCKKEYGKDEKTDISFRVVADHIRTISFAIADGQLPSNNKAGYVIRRILRRAVRYYYSFLDIKEPFLVSLVPVLVKQMGDFFPELRQQEGLITNVIREEETAFLKTLGNGIVRFSDYLKEHPNASVVDGTFAFELYDTYGFPLDLTALIARENNVRVDEQAFGFCMQQQKDRSRAAAAIEREDWVEVNPGSETLFVGYDQLSCEAEVLRYRKIVSKGKTAYQIVLSSTPFYAESGGQTGDTGWLFSGTKSIEVTDTRKENGLHIHTTDHLFEELSEPVEAVVDASRRKHIASNHSATHLMHAALRSLLGTHVEQKGSLVNEHHARFDFSHFAKTSKEELMNIERMVNDYVLRNTAVKIDYMNKEAAVAAGAMALFGEKYGDTVRVVTIDPAYSIELCGGTHVAATGEIGLFKIVSESAVAAGVRRIEALTGKAALEYVEQGLDQLAAVKSMLKNPRDLVQSLEQLMQTQHQLSKQVEDLLREKTDLLGNSMLQSMRLDKGVELLTGTTEIANAELLKDLCFRLKNSSSARMVAIASIHSGKILIHVALSDTLMEMGADATKMVREIAPIIRGGGGGQRFYASAGGSAVEAANSALSRLVELLPALIA